MSVHTSTVPDLADPQVAILETLRDTDNQIIRRADLAEATDEPYPPHERDLVNRGYIEEVGAESVNNGDGTSTIYRRLRITVAGENALIRLDSPGDDDEPDPVDPDVRQARRGPWYETAKWTTLAPVVGRLLTETQSVELIDEDHLHGPDETVRVTMERNGTTRTLEFSMTQWHRTGARRFNDEYRTAFQTSAGEHQALSEEQWGSLKARLIAEFADE